MFDLKKKIRGSLTVFFSFTMMMIVSLSFALTEVVHMTCLEQQADILADVGTESTFSDYNRFLWDNYGLLAVDSGYCTSAANFAYLDARMRTIVTENANPFRKGLNFLRMGTDICESEGYAFLSDDNGRAVIKEGVAWAKKNFPAELLSSVNSDAASVKEAQENSIDISKALDEAADVNSKAAEQMSGDSESGVAAEPPADPPDNPVDLLVELKGNTLLMQVFGSEDSLSDKSIGLKEKPSARALNSGTLEGLQEISFADRVLFSMYVKEKYQNYRQSLDHEGLDYEWEYLLMGNDCDRYNLSDVIGALLVMREAENFAAIVSDSAKRGEAETLALAIIGWTGIEPLVTVLTVGIEAAWAYLESILDIRLLMDGGRVSAMKAPGEWTSSLTGFAGYFPVSVKAKNCEKGFSYEDYLVFLTVLNDMGRTGRNCLNLLENAMYATEDYHNCRIDNHVYRLTTSFAFDGSPVFFNLIPYSWGSTQPYRFTRKRDMSYLSEGG